MQKNHLDENFLFGIISKIFGLDKENVIHLIFDDQEFKNFINEVYYELFRSSYIEAFDKIERLFSLGNYPFVNRLKEFVFFNDFSWLSYSKNLDLLKLFKNYIDIEDYNASDLKPKTYEIMVDNFNYVKSFILEKSPLNNENVIGETFDKLLFLPVKYSFLDIKRLLRKFQRI